MVVTENPERQREKKKVKIKTKTTKFHFGRITFITKKLVVKGNSYSESLKETETIDTYWCYILQNHADTSTKSK